MSYVANTTIDEFNDIIENHANVRALHAFAVGRVCHFVVSMNSRINMLNFKLDCIKNVVSRLMFHRNYFISFIFMEIESYYEHITQKGMALTW